MLCDVQVSGVYCSCVSVSLRFGVGLWVERFDGQRFCAFTVSGLWRSLRSYFDVYGLLRLLFSRLRLFAFCVCVFLFMGSAVLRFVGVWC